jgi:hypothetical protein
VHVCVSVCTCVCVRVCVSVCTCVCEFGSGDGTQSHSPSLEGSDSVRYFVGVLYLDFMVLSWLH